jgi:hypothetical protein
MLAKMSIAVMALGAAVGSVTAAVIEFDGLTGANGDPFTSYTEDGFTVDATAGDWFEAQVFGNPVPSIFAGPIGSPSLSTIDVTENGGGDFTFASVDFSSNNGTSAYSIEGLLNGVPVFLLTGTTGGFPGPWNTVNDGGTTTIDELVITLNPTGGPTSMNLDNINVSPAAPVPEPSSLLAAMVGLAALGLARRRRA